jgi:hypothetical protein
MLCAICTVQEETRGAGFLVELQNKGRGFPGLGLKIGSYGLVICASKSLQRFFVLDLKIKWEEVCLFAPQNRRGG